MNKENDERLEKYEQWYYNDNLSWKEIAEKVGTYANKVRRDATKLGIVSRTKAEAQRVAIQENRHEHPTKGKKRSDLTKKRISESQGKVWDNLSEEEKEYRAKIGLRSWNNKTDEERDEFFKRSRKAIQAASRDGSKVEKFLFDSLVEKGYRVEKHKEQILQNEKFHIDLYIPSCRMAIEVDGPMHFEPVFGEEKLKRRQAADFQKNGLILSSGMVLVRVKLTKKESQRYLRYILESIEKVIKNVETNFPEKGKRYIEI